MLRLGCQLKASWCTLQSTTSCCNYHMVIFWMLFWALVMCWPHMLTNVTTQLGIYDVGQYFEGIVPLRSFLTKIVLLDFARQFGGSHLCYQELVECSTSSRCGSCQFLMLSTSLCSHCFDQLWVGLSLCHYVFVAGSTSCIGPWRTSRLFSWVLLFFSLAVKGVFRDSVVDLLMSLLSIQALLHLC